MTYQADPALAIRLSWHPLPVTKDGTPFVSKNGERNPNDGKPHPMPLQLQVALVHLPINGSSPPNDCCALVHWSETVFPPLPAVGKNVVPSPPQSTFSLLKGKASNKFVGDVETASLRLLGSISRRGRWGIVIDPKSASGGSDNAKSETPRGGTTVLPTLSVGPRAAIDRGPPSSLIPRSSMLVKPVQKRRVSPEQGEPPLERRPSMTLDNAEAKSPRPVSPMASGLESGASSPMNRFKRQDSLSPAAATGQRRRSQTLAARRPSREVSPNPSPAGSPQRPAAPASPKTNRNIRVRSPEKFCQCLEDQLDVDGIEQRLGLGRLTLPDCPPVEAPGYVAARGLKPDVNQYQDVSLIEQFIVQKEGITVTSYATALAKACRLRQGQDEELRQCILLLGDETAVVMLSLNSELLSTAVAGLANGTHTYPTADPAVIGLRPGGFDITVSGKVSTTDEKGWQDISLSIDDSIKESTAHWIPKQTTAGRAPLLKSIFHHRLEEGKRSTLRELVYECDCDSQVEANGATAAVDPSYDSLISFDAPPVHCRWEVPKEKKEHAQNARGRMSASRRR